MNIFEEIKKMNIFPGLDIEFGIEFMKLFFQGEDFRINPVESAQKEVVVRKNHLYDILVINNKLPQTDRFAFVGRITGLPFASFNAFITSCSGDGIIPLAAGNGGMLINDIPIRISG